jgi:hypothetical protein
MTGIWLSIRRAALAAVLVLGAAVVPGPASAAALAWAPCAEDRTAQCAALSVPVDWSRPDGPRFDLALVRLPAAEPAARTALTRADLAGPLRDLPAATEAEARPAGGRDPVWRTHALVAGVAVGGPSGCGR